MRVPQALVAAAVALAVLAGCSENEPTDDSTAGSASFDDLRSAEDCPLQVDTAQLPSSLELGDQGQLFTSVSADEETGMVQVVCQLTVDRAQSEPLTVHVAALPAGSQTELFSIDSFQNLVYNETGVEMAAVQQMVDELAVDEVGTLEGSGESLAVRRIEVEGAGNAVMLVYGPDALSEDALRATAAATTW